MADAVADAADDSVINVTDIDPALTAQLEAWWAKERARAQAEVRAEAQAVDQAEAYVQAVQMAAAIAAEHERQHIEDAWSTTGHRECVYCGAECDSRTLTCGDCAAATTTTTTGFTGDRHPISGRSQSSPAGIHPDVAAQPGMVEPIPRSGCAAVLTNWVPVPGMPGKFRHISTYRHDPHTKVWDGEMNVLGPAPAPYHKYDG